MDLDASAVRSVPATPSVTETVEWILRGFQQIGANATMGTRLGCCWSWLDCLIPRCSASRRTTRGVTPTVHSCSPASCAAFSAIDTREQ